MLESNDKLPPASAEACFAGIYSADSSYDWALLIIQNKRSLRGGGDFTDGSN